ncbi:MAG TPA: hypothetical protein VG672_04825 [Bryobacteraceae bacterium]|jgi:hypothetical protein|nr:hypothetical protein [Bryobacteraceae bacterium]
MFSFLLGFGAGVTILLNGRKVQKQIARTVLDGAEVTSDVFRQARRGAAQLAEDFEDAFAQAREERAAEKAEQASQDQLQAELRLLRSEIATLQSSLRPSTTPPEPSGEASEPLQFQNISRERFDALTQKLRQFGIDVQSDSGTVSRDGFKVAWMYNSMDETLAIHFAELPPYVPGQMITRKIQEIVMSS